MSKHEGFTFIEIALFLAVTAALFLGVALGVRNSILRQQYNDVTQSFFEFMRSIYSEVSNPQSTGAGNSNYAIYGKMIVFGETTDLLGAAVPSDEQQIFVYDVVGSAATSGTGDVKDLLKGLGANVLFIKKNDANRIVSIDAVAAEKYAPKWGAAIEDTGSGGIGSPINKTILVVRHPRAGTINTLVYDDAIQVNEVLKNASSCISQINCPSAEKLLTDKIDSFSNAEVNFCVNPYGATVDGVFPRQNIRILSNARNASSVELIDLDGSDNKCL